MSKYLPEVSPSVVPSEGSRLVLENVGVLTSPAELRPQRWSGGSAMSSSSSSLRVGSSVVFYLSVAICTVSSFDILLLLGQRVSSIALFQQLQRCI